MFVGVLQEVRKAIAVIRIKSNFFMFVWKFIFVTLIEREGNESGILDEHESIESNEYFFMSRI